jgi:hypothetical protein
MMKSLLKKLLKNLKMDVSFMVIIFSYFIYFIGMYLEGARWNNTTHMLDDSKPK